MVITRKGIKRIGILSPIVLSILLLFSQPALALPPADYYLLVDTLNDDPSKSACTVTANDCSLRGAISNANAAPGGSVIYITIPAGTYSCMQPGNGEDDNLTGDLDVKYNSITLHGTGRDQTILDGQTLDRVVDNRSASLTIEHLKITQGAAPSGDEGGGGITNRGGAILHLNDVLIQDNSAQGIITYLDGGGGISNIGSMLVEASTITGNEACKGGGILLASATTTIRQTIISDNTASADAGCGDGGGIGMINGDILTQLFETTLEGNQGKRGAGMFYNGQHGWIIDSTFQENISSSYGGGIHSYGVLNVSRSSFSGNTTTWSGGGIFSDGSLTLQNSTIYDNEANSGGGIAIFTSETSSIDHATFSGNTATDEGSALFTNGVGTLEIHNTILASADAGNTCVIGVGNIYNDLGYNLSSDDSCGFGPATHDLINVNPLPGPLGNYGGITDTLPLLTGSPAIDTADPVTSQARDQRGWYRPVDGNGNGISTADIGAYEYASFELNLFFWLPLITK